MRLVCESLEDFLLVEKKKETKEQKKFHKVMSHWKEGEQHIGKSKKKVPVTKKGQKQAIAIAFSQIGKSKKK